jgi:hypothetical protein
MEKNIQYKITEKYTKKVIDEIVKIEKENELTAENLLEAAKNTNNPLHGFFDWDNSIAGTKWRLQQARIIINEVKIIVNHKERYAFECVQVKIKSKTIDNKGALTKRVYKPILEILSKEEYRKQIIQAALENIVYWKEKYSEYSEFNPIFVSIDKVKSKWQKK